MSDTDPEALIKRVVEDVLNERLNKLTIALWVLILGAIGSIFVFGHGWGKMSQEILTHVSNDDKHTSSDAQRQEDRDHLNTFITRNEWAIIVTQLQTSNEEIKTSIEKIESKLDSRLP